MPSLHRFVHRLETNAMFPHMKHQQKTARALQDIEPCRTVILRDLWSKPKPLITSMVSLSGILYVLPLLSQVNDTTQPRYQEPD